MVEAELIEALGNALMSDVVQTVVAEVVEEEVPWQIKYQDWKFPVVDLNVNWERYEVYDPADYVDDWGPLPNWNMDPMLLNYLGWPQERRPNGWNN